MIWGSEAPGLCEAQVKSEAHIRGEASQMHLTGLTAQIMKSLQTAKHAGDGRGEAQDPSPKALTPFLKELEYWSWKAFKMHFLGPTSSESLRVHSRQFKMQRVFKSPPCGRPQFLAAISFCNVPAKG